MYKHLDLFSGIGGFSLGLEATGEFETVAFCDYEPFCQKVLRKHWEEVPIYGDIKELTYEKLRADGIDQIDIITGGYPCQPFSVAGNKKGEQDPRHLWPEYFRLVKECRPTWVIGENVGGHIKLGLDTVLKDLESEGYSTRTFSISAASIGANHKRERVWIVANSNKGRCSSFLDKGSSNQKNKRGENNSEQSSSIKDVANSNDRLSNGKNEEVRTGRNTFNNGSSDLGNSDNKRQQEQWNPESIPKTIKRETERPSTERSSWWEVEPNVGRVVNGIPKRVDRLKSLGNSLIPQIPYYIGQSIIKSGRE